METRIKTVVALLSLVLIASLAGVSLYQGYAGRIEDDSTRILNVRDEFARLDPNGASRLLRKIAEDWKLAPLHERGAIPLVTAAGTLYALPDDRTILAAIIFRQRHVLVTGVIGLLLAVEAAIFLAWGLSRPLKRLAWAFDQIRSGSWVTLPPSRRQPYEVRRLTAIFNDMVDTLQRWKKLERQISRMDRLASLGQMVAGVSHEIRNPLASMRIHLDLLSDHVSDEGTESVRILGDELDRLNRTVSQLLAFASPRPPLSGPVAVNDLIRWCHQMLHASLRAGITWDASLDDDGLELWGDPQQLRQMLLNLLLNAQEAMPGGGAVRLAARKDGNTVEFRVSDTGPGLPDVLLERIFDPFVTTKGDGTGLGLSIVHRIVELHGGHIEYTTSPRGTTFIVRIPAGREETRQ